MVSAEKLYTMEAAVANCIQSAVAGSLETENMVAMAVEKVTNVPVSTQSTVNHRYLTKPVSKRIVL